MSSSSPFFYQKLRLFTCVVFTSFAIFLGLTIPPVIICTDQTGGIQTYCDVMQIILYVFFGLCGAQLLVLMGCAFYHMIIRDRVGLKTLPDPTHRTVLLVPCYGESLEELQGTVESMAALDGPKEKRLMVFVVDGLHATANTLLEHVLKISESDLQTYPYTCATNARGLTNSVTTYHGTYDSTPCIVLVKSENRGKKDSVTLVLQLLKGKLPSMAASCGLKDQFDTLLLLDADTTIDSKCLGMFEYQLGRNTNTIGICGETRVRTSWTNVLAMAQKYEYWYSHIILKTFEDIVSNVLVLSGCFTLYKLDHLLDDDVLHAYMTRDESLRGKDSMCTENIVQLGEDRYLSALLLRRFPESRLLYTVKTHCYTSVPGNFKTLLCQRRRWTNSLIHCHHFLLENPPVTSWWKRLRLFYVIIVELWAAYVLPAIMTVGGVLLVLGFIHFQPLPWFLAFLIACMLQSLLFAIFTLRVDMIVFWPAYFVLIPFFSIVVPLYSLWNSDSLDWGLTRPVESPEQSLV